MRKRESYQLDPKVVALVCRDLLYLDPTTSDIQKQINSLVGLYFMGRENEIKSNHQRVYEEIGALLLMRYERNRIMIRPSSAPSLPHHIAEKVTSTSAQSGNIWVQAPVFRDRPYPKALIATTALCLSLAERSGALKPEKAAIIQLGLMLLAHYYTKLSERVPHQR